MATKVPAKGRAGIYVRISVTARRKCRPRCRRKKPASSATSGREVVEVYTDAGRSAFKRDTPRPAFDRLLADVEAGRVDRVVAFKVDRLARNVADFIGFVDRVEDVGATVSLSSQDFDTSTASGRLLRTILASFAEFESELKRERIGGSMAHKAEAGKAHPGGTRLYGYSASRDEIVTDEAREIAQAAKRLLDGWSLAEIARSMNERAITTTTGGTWRPWVLGRLLRNPFLAGLRDYKGQRIVGEWPAILDEDTHAAVVELLDDPGPHDAATPRPATCSPGSSTAANAALGWCRGRCGPASTATSARRSPSGAAAARSWSTPTAPTWNASTSTFLTCSRRTPTRSRRRSGPSTSPRSNVEAAESRDRQSQLAEEWASGDLDRAESQRRAGRAHRARGAGRAGPQGRRSTAPALPRDRAGLDAFCGRPRRRDDVASWCASSSTASRSARARAGSGTRESHGCRSQILHSSMMDP